MNESAKTTQDKLLSEDGGGTVGGCREDSASEGSMTRSHKTAGQRQRDPEKKKKRQKKWRENNQERIKEYDKNYILSGRHAERKRARTEKDPQGYAEKRSLWLQKTGKGLEYSQKYQHRPGVQKKNAARHAVHLLVSRGTIIKSDCCEVCGSSPLPLKSGRSRIGAHHYLGYEREHWFDIVWVCNKCHRLLENFWCGFLD